MSDNEDDPLPAECVENITKPQTFVEAFDSLKNSEFYRKPDEACKNKASTSGSSKAVRPSGSKSNPILVSPRQRGNPLLKSIFNVPWEYEDIIPDYVMGRTTCALFLSLRYHNLNPDYINERLKQLGKQYELRVLLVQVDTQDPHHALKNLTRISILTDVTLMLAWSAEEAGRIIETYKIFENKPPDMIMEKQESGPYQKLVSALTTVRSINRTDATTLLATFGSLEKVLKATPETLGLCPGLGPQKANRLHRVLHQPFLRESAVKRKRLSQPQGRSATRRIMSMKNSNGTIRNRTHDLPVCSAMPQPTAPPHTPTKGFCHVLSKKLSSCVSRLLNNEEKQRKESVNPCRHLMSAREKTDVVCDSESP